jgi:hypothetical protein
MAGENIGGDMRDQEQDAASDVCLSTKPDVVIGSDDASARSREEDPCRIRKVFRPPNRPPGFAQDGVEQTSSVRESTSRSGPHNQPALKHKDPRGLPSEGGVSWGTGIPAARSLHDGVRNTRDEPRGQFFTQTKSARV